MKLSKSSIGPISFYHREGFSDLKTFEEVIGRKTYLKRGMTILPGERWMDCGGNVGAFTLLATHLGANVTVYEPDPYNADMIRRNLKLNGMSATIKQAALVHDDTQSTTLYIGNNSQTWRNSIVRRWNNKGLKVPCLNFDDEAKNFDACKMDIEGAEMPILENCRNTFSKLVYEWSFDIDPSLPRLWNVLDRQKQAYRIEAAWSSIYYETKEHKAWKPSWFPACTNVFCYAK